MGSFSGVPKKTGISANFGLNEFSVMPTTIKKVKYFDINPGAFCNINRNQTCLILNKVRFQVITKYVMIIDFKGQINSECQPNFFQIIALPNKQGLQPKKTAYTHQKITKTKCYDPCLFGRAEILVIFGLHFGRNDDLINSF